jgi:dTDP-4-amino-4,6-dideoxygalactose transaminase
MSTGWEREFIENKSEYFSLFEDVLSQKQEADTSFLDESLCKLIGRKYSVSVANGTDALFFILTSLGIKTGDEVLVSNFSWISSASCVSMVGATPVFCDVDINTYHISLDSIKKMVSSKTKAIVYPHLFGNMSDTKPIIDFCNENNIHFVEDACQAIGTSYQGIKAGTLGVASALSFNSNKNIAGIAGGGAILTDDENIFKIASKLRVHGKGDFLGYNSKMLLLNAKVIDHRLKNINKWQYIRQTNAKIYNDALKDLPLTIHNNSLVEHNYHKYVVRFEDKKTRDRIQKIINATVHYECPISELPMYKNIHHRKDDIDNSRLICDTILTLPLNHFTEVKDIFKTIEILWNNV